MHFYNKPDKQPGKIWTTNHNLQILCKHANFYDQKNVVVVLGTHDIHALILGRQITGLQAFS